MTLAVATAALAPLYSAPDVRSELVSQAPLGHLLTVREEQHGYLRVRTEDGYPGWIHAGYVLRSEDALLNAWRQEATLASLGATLACGAAGLEVPLGARLAPAAGGAVRLPDGRVAEVTSGRVAPLADLREEARALAPAAWVERYFGGAPYLLGGMTPWGVDGSGLVQVTFAMRGVAIPRDSAMQAEAGEPVDAADADYAFLPGDLLFFAAGGDPAAKRVGHVALADGEGGVIHAWLPAGGVVRTPLRGDARAEELRRTFVRSRRPEAFG